MRSLLSLLLRIASLGNISTIVDIIFAILLVKVTLMSMSIPAVGGNEMVLQQLIVNIAPHICRPPNTAFLSIRHQSDLKQSRPVVAFMIENVNLIFTKDLKPKAVIQPAPVVAQTARVSTVGSGVGPAASGSKRAGLRLLDLAIDDASNGYVPEDSEMGNVDRFGSVVIGSHGEVIDAFATTPSVTVVPAINTHTWEWNVCSLFEKHIFGFSC